VPRHEPETLAVLALGILWTILTVVLVVLNEKKNSRPPGLKYFSKHFFVFLSISENPHSSNDYDFKTW
jgi:hypothetical protein